ncbi:alpha/beta hydrolase [Gelidibacter maritimus]|uniref:Alpha/beta hydrolase n=1 Tax=Gelidibacter maritimus TaxID=2761487 RepID=A0A7W2R3R9_9FLAO|nr:alpha/beta hydrolase-fold protein [Gelidibacter maritimus]MBA6153131.1 alpha/beta hydrolase [Gelidibacter maritimus]
MNSLYLFFLGVLITFGVSSQNQQGNLLVLGRSHKVYSNILNENRTYYIYLPEGYGDNTEKKYAVVYLLDANINFHSYTGIQHMLSRGRMGRGIVPEMIVVGIVNTNRIRDFTPTRAKKLPEKFRSNNKMLEDGGGLEKFLSFIKKELRPIINKSYNTNGNNTLIGHSLGGLATVYTLMHHPKLFSHYLAIDPSFWWDDEMILRIAPEKLKNSDFSNTKFFFTSANHNNKMDGAVTLKSLLEDVAPKGLFWDYKYYENENHGSVIIPSEYDGLKFLFRD